jgi:hypothetical protein
MDTEPRVISAQDLSGVELTDGGDTVAVKLVTAEGEPCHILISRRLGVQLLSQLRELEQDEEQGRGH